MNWPTQDYPSMRAFYGKHVLGPDGHPTSQWEDDHLVVIPTPYPFRLAWETTSIVTKIRCHAKISDALIRVLNRIKDFYKTLDAIQAVRMDLYGGCYNYRCVRGAAGLSVHAWGAAIDLDPDNNPLGKPWSPGMIPMDVVDMFKAEGSVWGGDFVHRQDCQHFQFTK